MRIAIAPDSFKESLSAVKVAEAIKRGILMASPEAETVLIPMADGGEGTVEAVVNAAGGRFCDAAVPDPLNRPVSARWGMVNDAEAVIEMAAASGLDLLKVDERDPLHTTTRGTGTLISRALDSGARKIVVGVGGSATVDGGTGMAAELGVKFLDSHGRIMEEMNGGALERIARIDMNGLDARADATEFVVACDVTNPLVGAEGAARVYGPQKGADEAAVERLEKGLENLAEVIEADLGVDIAGLPGGGAAGGLGAGLSAFLNAEITSGVQTVLETVDFTSKIQGCDLVITGEGAADYQSAFGKTPAGVAGIAQLHGIPAVMVAGRLGEGYRELYRHGITALFGILDGAMALEEALSNTSTLLEQTAESIARLYESGVNAGKALRFRTSS